MMRKNLYYVIFVFLFANALVFSETTRETLCTHKAVYDDTAGLLAWYKPDVPGAAYDHVIDLAANFIKTGCPTEPTTHLPLYMVHSWFLSPREAGQEKFEKGLSGSDDGHTPACTYANFVESLVLRYYPYSGDDSYIGIVGRCLDHLLEHGTTPAGWTWANCPYASANPRSSEYFGATHWGVGGRNDGPFVIEPDKVADMGLEYLNFYKVTGQSKYLKAATDCADALVKNVRVPSKRTSRTDKPFRSPWPFRVSAENGQVHEQYTANVIGAIALFDELVCLKDRLGLPQEKAAGYKRVRRVAWDWLFSTEGPMRTFVWKGYFEDIPHDEYNRNRVQNIPLETARYLITHPGLDRLIDVDVPAIIYWVATAFGTDDMDAIKEQFWCYAGMGSHTARYASICAMWYERTKNEWFKQQACRFFNWATYVCDKDGYVVVGPDFPAQYWFSDGYGDYIRHFIDGIAAIPEWAPADENHLLRSTSVVQKISYKLNEIAYRTYDNTATEVLRITAKPKSITVAGNKITERADLDAEGWTWQPLKKGGVLKIRHTGGPEITINM